MNNREYSILIIGNFENVYIVQYVKHLKKCNPQAHLYFWGYTREESDTDRSFLSCYEEYCFFNIRHLVKSSPLWQIKAIKELRKSFKAFVSGRRFDYINIHYVKPEYFFLLDVFKHYAYKLVLTPWGSDVYGVHGLNKFFVKRTFDAADYITGSGDRFTKDFKRIFFNI